MKKQSVKKKTKIPKYLTESEVESAIENAVNGVAHDYVFGYFDLDDIKQEIRRECWEALERHKEGMELKSFLFIHARNRMSNLKRNKYRRNDPPCKICHEGRHHEHEDGHICKKYEKWAKTNNSKQNIVKPMSINSVDWGLNVFAYEEDDNNYSELREKIDKNLPSHLRPDYLRFMDGQNLPKKRYEALIEFLKTIITNEEDY